MKKNKFKNKNILIAGGTGLVGQPLTRLLLERGANVFVASLDNKSLVNKRVSRFYDLDLRVLKNCITVSKGKDIVFSLLGVTGSPAVNNSRPATFMNTNMLLAFNMLEGARIAGVKEYLYTSTYGVYSHSGKMKEDQMWNTNPSYNDRFAGWAKRMGELQIEAYKIEHNWKKIYTVRPANIYGPYANFSDANSMVIPSLIKKFASGKNPIKVWGDGVAVRDFINSKDVARMMIKVVEKEYEKPINLGSGKGTSIKQLVKIISESRYLKTKSKVIFDKSQPSGDKIRVLDTSKANKLGIKPIVVLSEGINEMIKWYIENKNKKIINQKYNAFQES